MEEIWKQLKTKYSDIEISNFGNIRGNKFNCKPFDESMITLKDGRRYLGRYAIYRLVWNLFMGPVENGYVIHHIDHNKLNDRLDNLMLMLIKDHMQHHNTGIIRTAENKENIRKGMIGAKYTVERRKNISEAKKNKCWYNNGIIQVMKLECPEGFVPGRLTYKNKMILCQDGKI